MTACRVTRRLMVRTAIVSRATIWAHEARHAWRTMKGRVSFRGSQINMMTIWRVRCCRKPFLSGIPRQSYCNDKLLELLMEDEEILLFVLLCLALLWYGIIWHMSYYKSTCCSNSVSRQSPGCCCSLSLHDSTRSHPHEVRSRGYVSQGQYVRFGGANICECFRYKTEPILVEVSTSSFLIIFWPDSRTRELPNCVRCSLKHCQIGSGH